METQAARTSAGCHGQAPSQSLTYRTDVKVLKWEISTYMALIFSKPFAHHSHFQDQLEPQSGHALIGLDYQITMQLLGNKADFRNTRAARQLCTSLLLRLLSINSCFT